MDVLKTLTKIQELLNNIDKDIRIEQGIEYTDNGEIVAIYNQRELERELINITVTLEDKATNEITKGEYNKSIEYLRCLNVIDRLYNYLVG